MIYLLDKEPFSDQNETIITNEIGEIALRFESKPLTLKRKLIIYDRYYVPIGTMTVRSFKQKPNYDIYYDEKLIASLHYASYWVYDSKKLKTAEGATFTIKGKVKKFDYVIKSKKKVVAKVNAELADKPHQFGIEPKGDKKDKFAFLCAAMAMAI